MSENPDPPKPSERSLGRRLVSNLFALLLTLVYLLGITWASGAVYYDSPLPDADNWDRALLALGYALIVLLTMLALGSRRRRFLGWVVFISLVAVPWSLKKPVQQADWKPTASRLPLALTEGNTVTFHNFRHFDYDDTGKPTERWESRSVDLSKLEGLDFVHHALGDGMLAHPLLSFNFGDDGRIAFSVEARFRKGQEFSPLRGLYKQYSLIYLVGDERDFLKDRAIVRNEPVRLYRLTYPPERIREIFLETIETMNGLREKPRFYNSLTTNCTTSYIRQAPAGKRPRFDYRIILNGFMESLFYERGLIAAEGLSLKDLVDQAAINEAAREAREDPAFSDRIREGRAGF